MNRVCRISGISVLIAGTLGASAGADSVHVVQPGESLWTIAAVVAGNPYRWEDLYRANRDQIKDPALLYPGQRLAIPESIVSAAKLRQRNVSPDSPPPLEAQEPAVPEN